MTTALHLADENDLDRILPMIAAYHAFEGFETTKEARKAAVAPLLQSSPLGAVWLIGPRRGPVGYIVITFGWSIEMGGLDGFIDEFYIRENVRGRGMGTEVLAALMPQLASVGLKALHLEVAQGNTHAQKIYQKRGFRLRSKYNLMTWMADGLAAT